MTQSALLRFESSAFAVTPGEDEETNPGIYGKSLAQWLSEQLASRGVRVTGVIAEDFGWCVGIDSTPHAAYVACASTEDELRQWGVFVFAEGGLMARLLGKDKRAEVVASLFALVKDILSSSQNVSAMTEEAD
jgi:hypothetical protein